MAEEEALVADQWQIETIPDKADLFYRVHKNYALKGLGQHVFHAQGGSMSTDWCRYASAEAARLKARTPEHNGILQLNVGSIRALLQSKPVMRLEISHSPTQQDNAEGLSPNRAHTDVTPLNCAIEDTSVRYKLWEIAGKKWRIDVSSPVCENPPPSCTEQNVDVA